VLTFLALAASAGFASLLTPCVLPVVPLTAGYFAGRRQLSGSTPVIEASLFAIGIIATFTGLGLGLSMVLGASGVTRLAANPWLNLFVAAVFVAFALSLLGLYALRIPAGLLTRADQAAREAPRIAAPVLTGFVFTLATFACTAPFVGPLLVAASAGEWTRPVAGMLVYSTAFALPFFVLGLAPRWVKNLPAPGRWMTDAKIAVATLQLGAALKFLSNAGAVWGIHVLTREVVLTVWVLLMVVLAATILLRAYVTGGGGLGPGRVAATAGSLALGAWLAGGLTGTPMGELEAVLPARAEAADDLPWIVNDLDAAVTLASAEGRPVFVDFTGYTCGNCRWMESNVFTRANVRAALAPYVLVRLYTDGEGEVFEKNQRLQEARFGTVALPLYAVLDDSGATRASFVGVARNVDSFVGFLRAGSE
jgi:thiol:disulfide interchange protein